MSNFDKDIKNHSGASHINYELNTTHDYMLIKSKNKVHNIKK